MKRGGGCREGCESSAFLSFSGKSVCNNVMMLDIYPVKTWSFDLVTAKWRC